MVKVSRWLFPQILILMILGWKSEIFLSFLFIIIHELSHYYAARALHVEVEKFNIHPLGTTIELQSIDELSHREEIIIFSVGALSNLMLAVIFLVIYKWLGSVFLHKCFVINLALGSFNLIPAVPLDGAKILKSILSLKMLFKKAHNIIIYSSFITVVLFCLIFVINFYYGKINISILLITVMIFIETYKEKGRVMYIIMGDIIRKQKKFLKSKYIINRMISVHYKEGLLSLLGYTNKNTYHIFLVLDDNMKVIGEVTEQEVVEALKVCGNISLEEYINSRNKNTLV